MVTESLGVTDERAYTVRAWRRLLRLHNNKFFKMCRPVSQCPAASTFKLLRTFPLRAQVRRVSDNPVVHTLHSNYSGFFELITLLPFAVFISKGVWRGWTIVSFETISSGFSRSYQRI